MTKAKSTHVGPDLESANPCRVTIWYEDASAHERALEVCREVAHEVGPHLTFNFTEWRIEELDQATPANQAIKDAASADIVLISTRSATVPEKTRKCLEACARNRKKQDGALAWLVVSPPGAAISTETLSSDLRHAASKLRMDFLPPGVLREAHPVPGGGSMAPSPKHTDHGENESPGYVHWGLNE